MTEVWRAVPGWEDAYEVSSHGRVRSKTRYVYCGGGVRKIRGKLKKPFSYGGYLRVTFWRKQKASTFFVQRLVLLAFVGPPPEDGMEAHHYPDPDPGNNRLENLQWASRTENMEEMIMRNYNPLIYAIHGGPGRQPGEDDDLGDFDEGACDDLEQAPF